jgi:hypothetical protein
MKDENNNAFFNRLLLFSVSGYDEGVEARPLNHSSRHRAGTPLRRGQDDDIGLSCTSFPEARRPRPIAGNLRAREGTKASAGPLPVRTRALHEVRQAQRVRQARRSSSFSAGAPGRKRGVTAKEEGEEKSGGINHLDLSSLVDASLSPGQAVARPVRGRDRARTFVLLFKVVVEVPPSLLRVAPS